MIKRSGNSTLRIFVKEGLFSIGETVKVLNELGCETEGNGKRLLTISVPKQSLEKVMSILKTGEKKKLWEYEEAFLFSDQN